MTEGALMQPLGLIAGRGFPDFAHPIAPSERQKLGVSVTGLESTGNQLGA
jgi:hypothetical protein